MELVGFIVSILCHFLVRDKTDAASTLSMLVLLCILAFWMTLEFTENYRLKTREAGEEINENFETIN